MDSSSSHDNASLFSLPLELWLHILALLDPMDLLSLQSTCTNIRHSAACRTAWQNVLHRVMAENDVFAATFPITTMSTGDLAHAALAPQKFRLLLQRHGTHEACPKTFLKPASKRTIEVNCSMLRSPTYDFNIHLLPGGRYLLVWAKDGLSLFDLGCRSNTALSQEPIFALSGPDHWVDAGLPPSHHWMRAVFHAFDQDDLILFVIEHIWRKGSSAGHRPATILVVYRLKHLNSQPAVERINRLTITPLDTSDTYGVYFAGCCVRPWAYQVATIRNADTVQVWDCALDRVSSFRIGNGRKIVLLCALGSDTIICRSLRGELLVYKLPPFVPVESVGPPVLLEPLTVTPLIPELQLPLCESHPLYRKGEAFMFDFVVDDHGRVARFRVDGLPAGGSSESTGPRVIHPTSIAGFSFLLDPNYAEETDVLGPRICDGIVTTAVCQHPRRVCSGTDDLVSLVVHLRGLYDGSGQDTLVRLLGHCDSTWRGQQDGAVDMCPASGRVCEMIGTRLTVYDFLPPPVNYQDILLDISPHC